MTTTQLKEQERGHRRELRGVVVSDKMQKTIVVEVTRRVQHQKYKKFINLKKKYHVHDEKEEAGLGDYVMMEESRPLSKLKRWTLKEIIKKGESE
ncbi:MAG: 30S ribosomal protein S17 [Deltaproteobacteria bacterium GWA2_38_16]|nr:MAG: 30S ribosomal protein S17 [Deltaproteobacteria bacterium GWA2_38_16]OGQ03792.1 MAG: 30S ribosomal protein S17 [Deltaproteobacteria bacterium RIFCSPHIGHO2_02_FULL_38_15]OGQ34314.1 MAG: 30S ribosomal protein S17 [Deltaproteobacteria bacterium RIFCSPLOWO2_01_FULL_38_9]OGQ59140.1 MAG: 30S ribosomal protein S17 [Deltaproteobacteria bacterium RIFCSPLOWO2_12_FULL_38_8]HBQ20831.1 30S ribosomal protein S17 [Deltaproteobacteria bacterium]